jgi:hypothetical protein
VRDRNDPFFGRSFVRLGKHFRCAIGVTERIDDDYLGRSVEPQFPDRGGCHLACEADISNQALEGHRTNPAGLGDSAANVWEFHFGSERPACETGYKRVSATEPRAGSMGRGPNCA